MKPRALLDLGCGDGEKLFGHLDYQPELFCGAEASPDHVAKAEKRGIKISSFDLNGRWPYADNSFDVVHCAFLIEHLGSGTALGIVAGVAIGNVGLTLGLFALTAKTRRQMAAI